MQNPRLATRYAKSIIDLATERSQLEEVYNDMKLIVKVCKSNPDFVAVLRSPIIGPDKKGKILAATISQQVSQMSGAFVTLLVAKGRESNLPEIAQAFIEQYNIINGISKVKITTAEAVSDEIKNSIISSVRTIGNKKIELEAVVNKALIGGFVLESEGTLVDVSVLRDLKDISKQFQNNDYVHKIR